MPHPDELFVLLLAKFGPAHPPHYTEAEFLGLVANFEDLRAHRRFGAAALEAVCRPEPAEPEDGAEAAAAAAAAAEGDGEGPADGADGAAAAPEAAVGEGAGGEEEEPGFLPVAELRRLLEEALGAEGVPDDPTKVGSRAALQGVLDRALGQLGADPADPDARVPAEAFVELITAGNLTEGGKGAYANKGRWWDFNEGVNSW